MANAAPTTSPAPQDNNIAATQATNASYAQANPSVFGSAGTQPASSTGINSSNLTPTQPINLPPPVQSPDTTNSIVGGAQQTSKSVQDYVNQLTPTQPTAADQQQQSILNSIAGLTGQDTGKDQALLDAQHVTGATQDQADLTSLNNQLLTKTASYNQQFANLGGNNSVETSAVLNAQTAGLQRAQAADIGLTTAQIQAKQGDLTLAMNTAQNAVNAKYSTIEDNIKTQQAQLAALAPALSAEEKTTALAQQQVLKDQADAVQAKKDAETQINNVALQAAQAGASSDVIAAISQSPDVVSAIAAAAPALGAAATQKLQQQQFDNNVTLQQLAISKAQEGIAAENANTTREEANIKIGELQNETSPQAILQYAQQYQATGVMPQTAVTDGLSAAVNAVATGIGTKDGQPAIPLPTGTIINNSTKVADTKLNSQDEQSVTQLYNIVNNVLPQLASNFSVSYSGLPSNDQTNSYQNTASTLNAAIDALSSAGILKGSAATLKAQIPNDYWGLNTSNGKRMIQNLTGTLTSQLTSYLSTNNLNIVGFNDSTDQSGTNSSSNLSNFLTK
jgi:hypothetical protein